MYCSNCGAKCSDGAQFCMKCGQRLAYDRDVRAGYSSDGIPEQIEPIKNTVSKSNNGSLTEERILPKIRFPVAGIFLILHGMLSLYHAAYRLGSNPGECIFVGTVGYFFWPTLLQFFIIITTSVLLLDAAIWILLSQHYTIRVFVLILCLIAENFFLGWWLAHPYKTYKIPAYHPNPASETASSYSMASEVNLNNNPG